MIVLASAQNVSARWTKLNCRPVCYGGRGNSYGVFPVDKQITAYQVKLVHVSGRISCAGENYYGSFNCPYKSVKNYFEVHLTDPDNKVIVPAPPVQYASGHRGWYYLNGNKIGSNQLVFSTGLTPYTFKKRTLYRVWYGEDLFKYAEGNNPGKMCVDVYAML